MSFFPRELAFLARPLADLLEAHGAAIDPNLLRLAEAYEVVRAKLQGEAGEEAREASKAPPPALRPDLNDVRAALGLKRIKRKKKGEEPKQQEDEDVEADEEEEASPKKRAKKTRKGDVSAPSSAAPPSPPSEPLAFVASRKFRGARPGAVFHLGPQGLGYYRDAAQAQKASKPRRGDAPPASAADASAALSRKARRAKAAVAARPIGGRAEGDAPLPGLAWRRGKGAEAVAHADSDDEGGAPAPAKGAKKKSLPGRLRKKLARDAAAGKA